MTDELEGKQITALRIERMILSLAEISGPEARLLAAILTQAVLDATENDKGGGPSSEKRKALDYFERGGHESLCGWLGIDKSAPQRWITRARAAGLTSN
jgi:hypothetical protein